MVLLVVRTQPAIETQLKPHSNTLPIRTSSGLGPQHRCDLQVVRVSSLADRPGDRQVHCPGCRLRDGQQRCVSGVLHCSPLPRDGLSRADGFGVYQYVHLQPIAGSKEAGRRADDGELRCSCAALDEGERHTVDCAELVGDLSSDGVGFGNKRADVGGAQVEHHLLAASGTEGGESWKFRGQSL